MDPLSLTANLIAVANAATSASEAFRRILNLRHVQQEVLQFINEISDFRTCIEVVRETLVLLDNNDERAEHFTIYLHEILNRAIKTLTELNDIIQTKIILNSSSHTIPVKISRAQWLRRYTQVKTLVEDVRKSRLDLSVSLAVFQVSQIPRTRTSLEDSILHNQELSTRFERFENKTTSQFEDLQPRLQLVNSTLQDIQTSISGIENIRPTIYEIRTTTHTPNKCHGLCKCRCHQRFSIKSPGWMQSVIGHLFVGYSGTPLLSNWSCNEWHCQRDRKSILKIAYFFPGWFLHRIILINSRWSPTYGHVISIKTPRIIGKPSMPVFLLSTLGNLIGLQSLFSKGLASPFDTDSREGTSPLVWAIVNHQYHICEFLLSQGANPEALDLQSRSPLDAVWRRVLGAPDNKSSREFTRIFSSFLDIDELLVKRNFTTLHKIILKLSSIPLRAQLTISTSDIETRCLRGTSPLETAIYLKDTSSVRTLLEFGASFRNVGLYGHTPIHDAAASCSPECMRILLSVAAKMDDDRSPRNMSDTLRTGVSTWTQLSFATTPWFEDLLEQRAPSGTTALQLACYHDHTGECARLLLDYSAEVNNINPVDLSTSLSATLQVNNYATLSHILRRAPDQNFKDKDGMGMLHYLAYYGDKKTFEILVSRGVIRVTATNDRDNQNHTPLECFDMDRSMFREEDAATRSWCREALLQLINWRDNNPFPDDAPSHDAAAKDPPILPTDSEEDVFYDFDQPIG